jgi:hypothetical protein
LVWWVLGALAAGVVLTGIGTVAVTIAMGASMGEAHGYNGHRHIDDPALVEVIDRECAALEDDLAAIAADGPTRILQENEAVEGFVDRVLGSTSAALRSSDRPTEKWLDQWMELVEVRDDYAQRLEDSSYAVPPTLPQGVPDLDGNPQPVTREMGLAIRDGCNVPAAITDDFTG